MADTPLHLHPSVLHLMGTEHWPNGKYGSLKFTGDQWGGWYFGDIDGAHSWIEEAIAHSLLTLAAVRAMWDHRFGATIRMFPVRKEHNTVQDRGWPFPGFVCCVDPDPAKISSVAQWSEPVEAAAPTELEAVLAAYAATVMENTPPCLTPPPRRAISGPRPMTTPRLFVTPTASRLASPCRQPAP